MPKLSCTICCSQPQAKLIREFIEIQSILWPVMLNMLMTLSAWYYVYDMKTDIRVMSPFLLDKANNLTTDNPYLDAAINGIGSVVGIGIVAFIMLGFALMDCRKVVQFWLYASCIMMLYGVSATFFYDLLVKIEVPEKILGLVLGGMTCLYGTVGVLSFFTRNLPTQVHQFYVLCNCSLVSLFYLRSFPGYTSWFVLIAIAVWDMFAVWAPMGPLRKVQEKAPDYTDNILRFLMFSCEAPKNTTFEPITNSSCSSASSCSVISSDDVSDDVTDDVTVRRRSRMSAGADVMQHTQEETSTESSSMTSCSCTCTTEDDDDDETSMDDVTTRDSGDLSESDSDTSVMTSTYDDITEPEVERRAAGKSAADALNDNTNRLGMGDFVFYGVLVGTVATNASIMGTIYAMFGVIAGLVITLLFLSNAAETTPALPVSVFLGMIAHFIGMSVEKILFGRLLTHVDIDMFFEHIGARFFDLMGN